MKLVDNWKQVAKESWAIHAGLTALALFAISELLYVITERQIVHPIVMGWTILGLLAWGCVARLFKQDMDPRVARWRRYRFSLLVFAAVAAITVANSAIAMGAWPQKEPAPPPAASAEIEGLPYADDVFYAIAVPFIAREEGKRNHAYQDIVGVWTICFGHTSGVKPGDFMTDAQCEAQLRNDIRTYRANLHQFLTPETKRHRMTPERDTAFTSLAINVGWAGAGKSTAVRRLNAGDIRGACEAMGWWNKAGGRVVLALANRRGRECALCMVGVA